MQMKFCVTILCLILLCITFFSCTINNVQMDNQNSSTTISSVSKTYYDFSDRFIDFAHCEKMSIVIEDSSLGSGEYILSDNLCKEFFLLMEIDDESNNTIENQVKEKYQIYCYEKETGYVIKFGFFAINQNNQIGLLTENKFKPLPEEWQNIEKLIYNTTFYDS